MPETKLDQASPSPARPGGRDLQKTATRNRVIEAARELFDAQGYEGATIRQIACLAGVSVGSVFTTFGSKAEVLSEVMQQRIEGLYAEIDRMLPHLHGSTVDRLKTIFSIFFAFETARTRLFLAHIAATYNPDFPMSAKPFGRTRGLKSIFRDTLAGGVERGDVHPAADLDAVMELLVATYAWTFRLAAWEGLDAKAMSEVMGRHIALIAAGFAPR